MAEDAPLEWNGKPIDGIRKADTASSAHRFSLWSLEIHRQGDPESEWYDLLEDPPAWFCDWVVEQLSQKLTNAT